MQAGLLTRAARRAQLGVWMPTTSLDLDETGLRPLWRGSPVFRNLPRERPAIHSSHPIPEKVSPRKKALDLRAKIKNQLVRSGDELRLHRGAILARLFGNAAPRVMFFPSGAAEGASLLRAYNLASALAEKGWQTQTVPASLGLSGRRRVIRSFRPNLIVFQQCRHALNSADHAFGTPFVLDTDDADFYLTVPGLAERLERTSRAASGIMAGSRFLQKWHATRNANTEIIWTGTPITEGKRTDHWQRQNDGLPILAWAQAEPLGYTEELDFVVDLACRLRRRDVSFQLRLYGIANEQDAAALRSRFASDVALDLIPPLPYDQFLRSLQEVAVGLSPIIATTPFSRGKSFGKILGYLDANVPVIASDEADHAVFFTAETGVVSNDAAVWEDAAVRLLADPDKREEMAQAAFVRFREELSIEAASERTDRFLRGLLA